MNWLRVSLRKWLGIGHEAELNNTVERLVARVGALEIALENLPALPDFEERIASLEHLIKKPVKVAKR